MYRVKFQSFDFNETTGVIITREHNGKREVAKPLEFEDYSNKPVEQPTIEISHILIEDRKELFTQFFKDWLLLAKSLGIKLDEDFTKEREVMKKHLEDMQKITFQLLDYETKEPKNA